MIFALSFILSGCEARVGSVSDVSFDNASEMVQAEDYNDVFVIEERFFVFRMWDIMFNSDDYLGRTIKYEGMFRTTEWDGGYLHKVYRFTDGCCGPDGIIGLEIRLDGVGIEPFSNGAWVEVIGILEEFVENSHTFLRLEVISIIEMDERGAEFVTAG